MDPEPSLTLEQQVGELRSRVQQLEETLRVHGIVPQAAAPAQQALSESLRPAPAPVSAIEPPIKPGQPSVKEPASTPTAPAYSPTFANRPDTSLESRIGSQWFNRIGILAVLISMAWFLKFAIDNHWIGPLGRILVGLIAGAALIAWSERFRSRGYTGFSYSLKAVGSGVLYLSLWASFSVFHLVPAMVAFAAMIAVTAFNGYMSWLQDSELLALYAIVGGLSTPLLLTTGANQETALLGYLLLLDLAVLLLIALRPWSRLLFAAFVGTALIFMGWWLSYYSSAQAWRTAFFVACFFLMFAIAPRLARVELETQHHLRWNTLALVLLPIGNAALGFLAFYSLLESTHTEWAEPWLAVGFALFYLLMNRLPAKGRLREGPATLSALHLTAVVGFLTMAIPLQAHGRWLTVGWLIEGAALLWFARRIRSILLRVLALLCLALGLCSLVLVNSPASTTPLFNQRFGTFCVGIAVFAFVGWVAAADGTDEDHVQSALQWHNLATGAVLTVNALVLLAVGWEIHSYWWNLRWHGSWYLMHDYRMYAQFTYSAFFMAFGAVLLGLGFWRRSAFLRWQSLLLLALTIGKVFLVDVSELSQGYRILSFLGLGALLLAVSFVYQRDLLNLRKPERPA